ncbi:MAG: TIGR02301 family protein [Hyphomicrobiales bacterium]
MKTLRLDHIFIGALAALLLMPDMAEAQAVRTGNEQPPYEESLLRLVTIVGSLEFLHPLCERQNKGVWKAQMANLLEAEEPSPARRARMMATYNKSYEVLEQVHRTCSPTVELILQRYEAEAVELTRELATTYRPVAPAVEETAATEAPTDDDATETPEQ